MQLRFNYLADRLLQQVSYLVHSGELTERKLSAMAQISQPHLHNILCGARRLTPSMADQLLECLGWSGFELLESEELLRAADLRRSAEGNGRDVPYADPGAGPGIRFPGELESTLRVERHSLHGALDVVVVGVKEDQEMSYLGGAGSLLLVSRETVTGIDPASLYVVDTADGSLVRWVRYGAGALYLVSEATRTRPLAWRKEAGGLERIVGRVLECTYGGKSDFRPIASAAV